MSSFTMNVTITAERIQEVIEVGLETEEYSSFVVVDTFIPTLRDKYGDRSEILALNTSARQRGLDVLCKEYPLRALEILEGNDDVVTADIYIQCCVYGKVVYS